jgi:hypothetical protein
MQQQHALGVSLRLMRASSPTSNNAHGGQVVAHVFICTRHHTHAALPYSTPHDLCNTLGATWQWRHISFAISASKRTAVQGHIKTSIHTKVFGQTCSPAWHSEACCRTWQHGQVCSTKCDAVHHQCLPLAPATGQLTHLSSRWLTCLHLLTHQGRQCERTWQHGQLCSSKCDAVNHHIPGICLQQALAQLHL